MLTRRSFSTCAACVLLGTVSTLATGAKGAVSSVRRRDRAIVDFHAHLFVEEYARLLSTNPNDRASSLPGTVQQDSFARLASDRHEALEHRIGLMDEAGVSTQVLSPGLPPYFAAEEKAVLAVRLLNDNYARVTSLYPGRIAMFTSLPMPHVEASLTEMRRGFDQLGAVGVAMHCSCLGLSIAEDRFAPLFAEMNARGTTLFVHPSVDGLGAPMLAGWNLSGSTGTIFEDTTIAIQMMVKAIPLRYPDIRILFCHLGGSLAMMLHRLDNQLSGPDGPLREKPSITARRFWYDTVGHGSSVALRTAIDAFGHDRLVPGSDFPVLLSVERYGDTFDYINHAGLTRSVADGILYHNARHLLRTQPAVSDPVPSAQRK